MDLVYAWQPVRSQEISPLGAVVVWESYVEDGSEFGVFGRRFDAAGNGLGQAFQVNTYTTGPQA
jgi:hypothetical protein